MNLKVQASIVRQSDVERLLLTIGANSHALVTKLTEQY